MYLQDRSREASGGSGRPSRIWKEKKQSIERELRLAAGRSPVMRLLGLEDLGPEVRAYLAFLVPTLLTPGPHCEIRTGGPVVVGMRYTEPFLTVPPIPWEVVGVISPRNAFHPNLHAGNGLCLGALPAGFAIEPCLHLLFAALVLQSHNCVEWEGLNPVAAAFVRENAAAFPLVPTGLYEEPPPDALSGMTPAGDDFFSSFLFPPLEESP